MSATTFGIAVFHSSSVNSNAVMGILRMVRLASPALKIASGNGQAGRRLVGRVELDTA
jgi:hypothetical protein